jgi:hypothetical protein
MKPIPFSRAIVLALLLLPAAALQAWDYEGHRIVNQLALASLPADFPAFVKEPAAAERIAFLAGEPDRWKNSSDLPLRHLNGVDHYLDLEELADAGIAFDEVPSMRYDFVVRFAAGRAAHPGNFPKIDPAKNSDHSREWPGFAPWAITEYYGKLKSEFSYLKAFQELGTPEEVANAQANIVYVMGVMGHYVGDCGQPLHATKHHNGWVGPNPNGYTTWSQIHPWIDGGLIAKAGITSAGIAPRVSPASVIALTPRADGRDPMFVNVMDYLQGSLQRVEPLYQLEKAGKLGDEFAKTHKAGAESEPVSAEGQKFIEDQLLRGGEMLGSIWLTAWRNSPPDTYLRSQLLKRKPTAVPVAGPVAPTAAVEYWASSRSSKHVFHKSTCEWAQKIKESNKVVFKTKAEAEAGGFVACSTCKP